MDGSTSEQLRRNGMLLRRAHYHGRQQWACRVVAGSMYGDLCRKLAKPPHEQACLEMPKSMQDVVITS